MGTKRSEFFLGVCVVLALQWVRSVSLVHAERNVLCMGIPEAILTEILGAAYNSRYMSITQPVEEEEEAAPRGYELNASNMKRGVVFSAVPEFYVDEDFSQIIAEEPAWRVNHVELSRFGRHMPREKREIRQRRQWECESRITWTDLGPDYFPRYLRGVECTSKSCWYGHFKCKPRSFTVKILRRRKDRCTVAQPGTRIGTDGLHGDLKELWVWEERAVNFCCDCAL